MILIFIVWPPHPLHLTRGKKVNQNGRQKHKGKINKRDTEQAENKNKTAVLNPHLSVITLNIHGLNSPIKRRRASGEITK